MKRRIFLAILLFSLFFSQLIAPVVSALQASNLEISTYSYGAPNWSYSYDGGSSYICTQGYQNVVNSGSSTASADLRLRIYQTSNNTNRCSNTISRPANSLTQIILYTTGVNYVAQTGQQLISSLSNSNRVAYFAPIEHFGTEAWSDATFWEVWVYNNVVQNNTYIEFGVNFESTSSSSIGLGVVSYVVYKQVSSSSGGSDVDLTTVESLLNTISANQTTIKDAQARILTEVYYNSNSWAWFKENFSVSISQLLDAIKQNTSDAYGAVKDMDDRQKAEREQDRQDVEDAQDSASDNGQDSANDASEAGTSLLEAFIGFVGAITSASPSNCKIDGDIGRIDLGELYFCAMPAPSWINIVGTLILVSLIVPLSLHLANTMINLFRSFTG